MLTDGDGHKEEVPQATLLLPGGCCHRAAVSCQPSVPCVAGWPNGCESARLYPPVPGGEIPPWQQPALCCPAA